MRWPASEAKPASTRFAAVQKWPASLYSALPKPATAKWRWDRAVFPNTEIVHVILQQRHKVSGALRGETLSLRGEQHDHHLGRQRVPLQYLIKRKRGKILHHHAHVVASGGKRPTKVSGPSFRCSSNGAKEKTHADAGSGDLGGATSYHEAPPRLPQSASNTACDHQASTSNEGGQVAAHASTASTFYVHRRKHGTTTEVL